MNFPLTRGKATKQPHVGLPEGTFEEEHGREGFFGRVSHLYHAHPPTGWIRIEGPLRPHAFYLDKIEPTDMKDANGLPTAILYNDDLIMLISRRTEPHPAYLRNADGDLLYFIHRGEGKLETDFGVLDFEPGDYIVIPRGMNYQIQFHTEQNRILYVESHHPIYSPKRYRNEFGQMLEHSPYCERDFKLPQLLETYDQTGDFLMKIKKQGALHQLVYATHPFDVVGWDGYNFPYGFSIHNFEPITGRVHQPPPVHQTFQTKAFVVCSFCPRLYDYHPKAIPAPYNHSNIDSDEVLYYVDGDFMSRNDIAPGYFTLHPGGIPHGPHPGAMERSIGKKETHELAVMVDTFRPLMLTEQALTIDDGKYYKSWIH